MLASVLTLTAVAAAILFCVTGRRRPERVDWGVGAMAAPALFLVGYRIADCLLVMLSDSWTYIRLMPGIALWNGYRLYYPDGEGPLLGWSYGPFMPCVQAVIGALPDPVSAVLAGGLLDHVVLLGPLLLLVWRVLPESPSRPAAGVIIVAALHALMMHIDPARFWLTGIQVDAFAMGFVSLGFWTLLGAEAALPVSVPRIVAAALLMAAGVFSKQNEFFALLAPVAWLALRDGRRSALLLVLALAAAGGLGVLLCLAAVGWEALFLNMWLVPARHPWTRPGAGIVVGYAGLFLVHASGLLGLSAVLAVLDRRSRPRAATFREAVLARSWLMPAAAALLIFPISVLGRVKVGGADNSNHAVYYLLAATGMLAAGLLRPDHPTRRAALPFAALALAAAAAVAVPLHPWSLEQRFRDNRLEKELQFSKRHPEQVWFSANPLVTLYTDRRLYHQGYGVYDRTLPNLPPTPKHLREHLPPKLRWVGGIGDPFWVPDGLTPIPPPEGMDSLIWLEKRN